MYDIYNDIAKRTGGDIYVGVVGPVRSGKSTFISRFMEELVLPNIQGNKKSVAIDELPQSAGGKTIMTTEPKFVPAEAVSVNFGNAVAKVKLIDCVGYLVDGAIGHQEEDKPRLVKTPWNDEPIPFEEASEIGTHKVIGEHSTVGVVITTDGSFTDISRSSYERSEERVISELKSLNKPFIVIYNTNEPTSKKAEQTRREMEEKYGVSVVCDNVMTMDKDKLTKALAKLLLEFPMRSFNVCVPEWIQALPESSQIVGGLISQIKEKSNSLHSMKNFSVIESIFENNEYFEEATDVQLNMGSGVAEIKVQAKSGVFYKVLSDECGEHISSETELMQYVKGLAEAKQSYTKLKNALECAESTGYGIVTPQFTETELTEPEVVKKTGGYCVRMKAKAKSLHIIRTDVETEVSPVYGTKQQCDNFVETFKSSDEESAYETGVFGRPLHSIIDEEVSKSSNTLCDNLKFKLRKTLTKAVNEKKSNLFCILI